MTDHAAALAREFERDVGPTDAPPAAVPAPTLRMIGAADAPNCDGDGCVVPFAASLPTTADANMNARTDTEGSPE